MNTQRPTALIADDEHLLIQALEKELAATWPELLVNTKVSDGRSAITQLLSGVHDIAFLDIQMPMENGIEVMQAVIEQWPSESHATPPPLFVFVTAHDEFAVDAFELAAIDYVVKPVSATRLKNTVERLQHSWQARSAEPALSQLVLQANELVSEERKPQPASGWLEAIRAGIGDTVHLIQMKDVIMFEASDKYVIVHTEQHQALIREPLRSLLPRLKPTQFRQIHRGTIINLAFVKTAERVGTTKMVLKLNGSDQTPVVSRLYRHLFKAM